MSKPELELERGTKSDAGKPDYSLLPMNALESMVKVLTFGANKYSRDNWRDVESADTRYFSAAMRHLVEHQRGLKNDIESGYPHLAHAACCLFFLLEIEINAGRGDHDG